MHHLGLVLLAIVGCHGRATRAPGPADSAVATAAAGDRLCPLPPTGIQPLALLAADATHGLRLAVAQVAGVPSYLGQGTLTVEGVVTSSVWPMNPPQVHRLPDGRSVLHDSYSSNVIWVWDPVTRELTELGRGALFEVPGAGRLVHTSDAETSMFSDIDPAAPRLRELWRFARGGDTRVAGVIDGTPALMVRPAIDGDSTAISILCLSGAGVSSRFSVAIPAGFGAVSVDPIDGHRLLLVTGHPVAFGTDQDSWGKPIHAEVAILDLRTGAHRRIGRAVGGWTDDTAVPHPYLHVRWGHGSSLDVGVRGPQGFVSLVDPVMERLVTPAF